MAFVLSRINSDGCADCTTGDQNIQRFYYPTPFNFDMNFEVNSNGKFATEQNLEQPSNMKAA